MSQQSLTVRRTDREVVLINDNVSIGMPWDVALAFTEVLRRIGKVCRDYATEAKRTGDLSKIPHDREEVNDIVVWAAGPAVVVEVRGRQWFVCNYRQVPDIVKAINWHAHALEEVAKAEQLIEDEAILSRTGLPIGLAYNPKIKREARKKAEDVKLPGMIEPTTVFYPPTIIQHPPKAIN